MICWLDAQLPPQFASWLAETFQVEAKALREIGLRDAADREIFQAARSANAVIVSKDSDFVELVLRLGTPPQLIWITCGNVTNRHLKTIFTKLFPDVARLLREGEPIVEICG